MVQPSVTKLSFPGYSWYVVNILITSLNTFSINLYHLSDTFTGAREDILNVSGDGTNGDGM